MKILIINTLDINGGAARAAYRLHQALLNKNIDSQMLVQDKCSDNYTVIGPNTKIQKAIGKIRPTLDSIPKKFIKNSSKTPFSSSWLPFSNILDKINEINPEIVHLHWICGGMMRIEDIAKIKAPIIWSLHDMWAFTDGYHYDENFDINKNGLNSEPKNFLSNSIFRRKQKVYSQKKDMTIVGLSKWINECSKSSELLKDKKHINLPNPIDTNIYKPYAKNISRDLWKLPKNKKLVLFGAMSAISDPRKGFEELSKAMKVMEKNSEIEFVVFGSSKPKNVPEFGFRTHYLGQLCDDVSLVTLYSAVDVMVVPSLQENLSNAIMESLACGTPVIGFDIGGNKDMIEHKKNGYLVKPFDILDLKNAIEWILNHNDKELSRNAREKVIRNFNSDIIVEKYIELYNKVLEE